MKYIFSFFLLLLSAFNLSAYEFQKYQWQNDRPRFTLTEKENAYAEYILKNHDQYNYVFEGDSFIMYETTHRIVRVNNREAIQHFNRIFISMQSVLDLIELKARSINKEGKVVNFDINNLKEIKDEESGRGYRIFAIEGIEIGSEIEYFYTLKKTSSIYDRVFVQYGTPVKQSTFLLTSPKHLKFDFKVYGSSAAVVETSDDDNNSYSIDIRNLTAMKEENFASFNANRQRIEFKLAYNTAKSEARLYTWDDAAKTFYRVLTDVSKDDDKALEKFVKTLDDNPSDKLKNRIKNIEQKIKLTVQINRDSHADDLTTILKTKLASREGITKLFLATFDKVKIKCEPVVTCDRSNFKFDGEFDTWNYLDDYILFFPDVKGFVAPYHFETRYPVIPAELTAQKGLFIEPYEVGNVKSAIASINEIPALDYLLNTDNLDIKVSFNEDMSSHKIDLKRTFGGINATFITPYYHLMNDEQKSNMVEELLKQTAPDPVISKWEAKPIETGETTNFLMQVNFTSSHFIEKAGPRILFKIGELIGPQTEMYRDDDRMNNIENDYNRGYDRIIEVKIPTGYQIRNPQDLKFNVVYHEGDKEPYLFMSDYTIKDDILRVTIEEYYKEIYAPLSRYEDYRKVINAAADFNKVTLVLEKKR